MKKISEFRIEYFDEPFLKECNIELANKPQTHLIPTTLNFNSPWRIIHNCVNCENEIEFIENNLKKERNYSVIKNINSNFRDIEYLEEICLIFPELELIELKGVTYINRTDFDYQLDMQRASSVELKHHKCNNCNSNYFSIMRIGYPLEREKGTEAKLGKIEVVQISNIEKEHILIQKL